MDNANNWVHSDVRPSICKSGVCEDVCIIAYDADVLCETLKRRLPPIKASGGLLNLRAFKSAPFTIYCISAFVIFLGLYTGQCSSIP
jgi:hypothetical protein